MAEKKSTVPAKTFSSGSPQALASKSGKPNVPDFSWDPETGKPVLAPGEEIVYEGEHNGLPIVITNCARRIYLCSLDEYEDAVDVVADREVHLHFYPQAAKPWPGGKKGEAKGDKGSPGGKKGE